MSISQETYNQIFRRAGGRCECTMSVCRTHAQGTRCNQSLMDGKWHAHHLNRYGSDEAPNLLAMCIPCHENTPSYGKPL
jgi:hypothetical protein